MLLAQTYKQHHSMLFGLAYRMLGIAADAEDIVQDVFAQYLAMDTGEILNEKAYLTRMTANRCINLLKSSRRQRETYTGEWLPEPLPDGGPSLASDSAERRENIGYAYLVLMQRLSPLERAIYILKETLGFEYRDIAEMLDKAETSCRKTFSRAKLKIGQSEEVPPQPEGTLEEAQERFVEAFIRASDTGNFKPLLAFLLDDVVLVSDGGGKAKAALNPIFGVGRVQAFFEGVSAKGSFLDGMERIVVNGDPGLALRKDGRITRIICAEWEPGGSRVRRIYMVLNPDKLTRFN
ncbi:sigma-70 family RNA polymerase sigma factor [Cohnella cholangitidis]|uniref:Sigma-70 family RNA polymerase sigma factor n=1 Tax=Cohnella cholangitidis TaxID=2598458 RepID=A0A7G5BZN6_9BACL|nr:sigma-70 family RNA polymerase sigma factor [Cohnella cholangitidis]QMV42420.1 sigma-70 family RNA polymerase sigma factor [Cohnella cholangitidis]